MPLVIGGEMDPEKPSDPTEELKILITVPEEFAGASQHELSIRQGLITRMEVKEQSVVIFASLPAGEYDGLVDAIILGTQGRARIDRSN